MSTQIILLERVDNLGDMGEIVSVKPGYARNYLLPQKKALRASKENLAYFETKKKQLEADNAARRKDAEKEAKALENLTVSLIRQASEAGQLYGSVTARDIADSIEAATKTSIARTAIALNQNFKTIGLFPVAVALHPEVKVEVTINIARNEEEAAKQLETGLAVTDIAAAQEEIDNEANLSAALTDEALEAEKEKAAAEAEEALEAEQKAAEKAAKKAEKAAKKAEDDGEEAEAEGEEQTAEAAEDSAEDDKTQE